MMDDPGEQEDSSMMLSTTPGGDGGAHHMMSQSHHRRRRPRPGSSPPPNGGLGDLLAFKKRQMLVAGGGSGGPQPHSSHPMHQQQSDPPMPLVHTHTHHHHHRGGAGFLRAPAATTLLPAAAALPASMTGGPFGRPSSPYCAAADLAAAASALSIMNGSGGSTPDDEPGRGSFSCPLVPVVAPATAGSAGWGFGSNGGTATAAAVQLLAVRCEWVPGPGSGKVHVVAPPAFLPAAGGRALSASAEIAALEESARLAHSFLRLWGPGAWAPLLTGKDAVVRFDVALSSSSSSYHGHHHQQPPSLWSQQQQRRRSAEEDGARALPPAAAALGGANPGPQLGGLGAGVFLALVQLVLASVAGGGGGVAAPLRFRPRVAVLGELTLEGRVVLPSSSSSTSRDNTSEGDAHGGGGGGDRLLAARVQTILGSGQADCVVLPREAAEGGGRAQLRFAAAASAAVAAWAGGRRCAAASVRFAGDLRELMALAVEEGPGADAQLAWLPPPRGTGGGGGGGRGSSGGNSSGQARRLFVAPTLLPADGAVAAVAARCVEACALPRPLGGPPGRFIVTGLPHASAAAAGSLSVVGSGGGGGDKGVRMPDGTKAQGGSSGSSNSSSARAALNTARFLLLKHQGDIARLLGPPSVDLRAMRLLPPDPAASAAAAGAGDSGMEQETAQVAATGVPVDIHLHLPHALPNPGYGLPALLALVAVAWPGARDSLEGIASLGEVNAVGALGLHARLRPTFVAGLNGCGARKVVLPRAQARELVREEGGGVGDRWLLQSGVMVQGADRVLDVVRGVFLGDDGL